LGEPQNSIKRKIKGNALRKASKKIRKKGGNTDLDNEPERADAHHVADPITLSSPPWPLPRNAKTPRMQEWGRPLTHANTHATNQNERIYQ
jgi:hypothetical protein